MALTKISPPVEVATPPVKEDGPYQRAILRALSGSNQHVYAGTVPPATKARNRAAGKVARASRRGNR